MTELGRGNMTKKREAEESIAEQEAQYIKQRIASCCKVRVHLKDWIYFSAKECYISNWTDTCITIGDMDEKGCVSEDYIIPIHNIKLIECLKD